VDYYLQAGAWESAAAAIEPVGPLHLKQAKTVELADWLQRLPLALMQSRPWLLLYHFLTGRFTGGPEYFVSLQQAHGLFQQQGDLRGLLLTAAHFLEVGTFAAHPAFPMAVLLSRAEELLQKADIQAFPYESAVLWFQVGLAKMLYSSDIRQGYQACRRTYFLAKEAGERHLESQALLFSYTILALQGDFTAAQEAYQEAEAGLAGCTSPDLQVLHRLGTSILRGFRGEVDQYETLVQEAQAQVEEHGLIGLFPLIMIHRLNSLAYAGKYAAAIETGLHTLNHPTFPMVLKGVAAEQLAIFYYHLGDLPAARQHIAQAREILLNEVSQCNYHIPVLKMAESVFSFHLGEELDAAADRELQDILHEADAISSYLFLVDIHWIIAFWRWRQGRHREAADHLRAGMEVAARRGSYFSLLFSPRDRGRAFTLALELGVEEVWDRLTPHLLNLAEWTESDLERLSRQAKPKIAAKAREIRLAIHRGRIPRLRLQTLGGFQLWRGDSLLDEDGREGQKAILLLKALIAHGARAVPKDVLMEDLWPETSQETGENNFKVFLYRLRKALEPSLDKTFGSSYLHLKGKLVSLDPDLCQVDVDEFLALLRQGEEQERQDRDRAALTFYQQALAVYRGDFLAEELYQPWAVTRREELKNLHLDLLFRLAALHERRGAVRLAANTYQQVIRTDPLAEEAYQKLMLLHARRGRRNAALRLYDDLRKVLRQELQAEPESTTRAIYQKILDSA
jgi:LuxR family maltose regulon positive regulatory protein